MQRKSYMFDSPGLVDFAVGLVDFAVGQVDSVHHLPNRKVMRFKYVTQISYNQHKGK